MVPIRTLAPIGTIGNYWATPHMPTHDEVQLLQARADSTTVAMENVQVYSELEQRVRLRTRELELANEQIRKLSLFDELTGLHNRRGFFVLAEHSRRAARRIGAMQFLVYVDANGLTRVDDTPPATS